MKCLLSAVVCCAMSANLLAQAPTEMKLYEQLLSAKAAGALKTVLKSPEGFTPVILFMGAKAAFENKRLEDSGFLFYAAQLRMRFDEQCFPPTGTGGDSPLVAYAALSHELGSVINPAVMDDPVAFANVVERIKKWQPQADEKYDPGYDHAARKSEDEGHEAAKPNREQFEKQMGELSQLLNNADYLAASRVLRKYNEFGQDQPTQAAYDKAIDTLVRIEKETGLKGFMAE